MSYRPLVFVFGLTLGDYLLWSWSLNGNHEVLALVSGLTLVLLALACVWMLAVSAARLLSIGRRRVSAQRPVPKPRPARHAARPDGNVAASTHGSAKPRRGRSRASRKIAA